MRLRRRRKHRKGQRVSPFMAGALGIVFLILISFGAYTKFANPLASHFTIHAVFPNANGLNPDSLVRIAGVNVGKVTGVSNAPGCSKGQASTCQAADVTMQIEDAGLPIHSDATFAIRPRIFLEGNFFVDVHPGSPSLPIASDGHTFPIQQGTEPVQLDQVLGSLQANTRQNLQVLLDQYGKAVDKSGPSYNRSIQYWLPAYKYTAIVAHDALGIQPHDLSNWVAQMGTVSGAFDAHPQNLESLITDFNTTANSFARQNTALANAVAELPRTLATATPAFNALNAAFPPLRALARALQPGVVSAGPAIDVSLPFIEQLRRLVQPSELRGLTSDLSVTVPALAKLAQATIPLMKNGVRPAASCVANVIYPWSQLTLNDHTLSGTPGFALRPVYVEAVDFLPGLAGESRTFDANGPYIRVLGNGGSLTYSLQPGLFGQALAPITSVQPQLPPGGNRPPLHSGIPCETQAPITDLSAPAGPPLQQSATDLSAPGAALRWKSSAQATVGLITDAAKQQGSAVTLSTALKQALK
jgi:phospholipid/cholesterol/gamma-HCH transport system substrate-binding protein